jgi:hypothetical protein
MFPRLKRTAAIAAVSLVSFLAYHVVAVPLIEPAFEEHDPDATSPAIVDQQNPKNLTPYFAPGSWPLDNPIVLESDRSKLLFKEYHNLENGRVKLFPCAILFFPNGETSSDVPPRVIVLEAPQGALLQFDGPVDLQRAKFGQLLGGNMAGPITIHGTPSRPGANDELFADTRGDLLMTPEKITTDAPVNFRFGPNAGHGRQMEIHLLPSNRPAGKQRGPNIGALQSIELLHEVEMHLVPGSAGMMPLDGQRNGQKPTAAATNTTIPRSGLAPIRGDLTAPADAAARPVASVPQPPVDIRCQGPFKFDLLRYIATFQNQVDVIRAIHDGPRDQMSCDLLSVYFALKKRTPGAVGETPAVPGMTPTTAGNGQNSSNLEPRRIEARGHPVIVRAESNGGFARAEHLDYDIITGEIALDDPQEMILRQFANEIHARSLVYRPDQAGPLGRLRAIGPGWLRAIAPPAGPKDAALGSPLVAPPSAVGFTQLGLPVAPSHRPMLNTQTYFEARWTDELKMRPFEGNHVVSLKGDARAGMTDQGELAADEIYVWLKEIPPPEKPPGQNPLAAAESAPPRWQVVADKLLAKPHVRINSPQLTGSTSQLEAWFDQAPPGDPAFRLGSPGTAFAGAGPMAPSAIASGVFVSPSRAIGPSFGAGADPQRNAVGRSLQHFNVEGERIRIQFLTGGARTEVEDITIDGHAQFGETQTAQPGDVPLLVAGEQIEVLRANAPDTRVTVSGTPAEVAARGLEMYGDVVHMDKGSNRVWIDAPGRMKLPATQPTQPTGLAAISGAPLADNRPLTSATSSIMRPMAPADPMIITWKDRMMFDGTTAHFEHSVAGQSNSRKFQTDVLEVSLRRRIDFSQPRMEERAEIGRIVCRGGMDMETRSFDPDNPKKLMSLDRMHTGDLMINEETGAILGQGPGWLTSVRRGSPDPTQPAGASAARSPTAVPVSHNLPDATAKPSSAGRHRSARQNGTLSQKSELNYLNVQFDGALSGNLNQHEITFHDRVRSVYGPVLSWEDQLSVDVDDLGPGGVLMTCDQLTVRQTTAKPTVSAPERHPIELEAIGNTSVEGEQFRAIAHRLTYSEDKDLLMLEGDGRTDAQLFRQERPGDPLAPTAAKRIFYWRSANRIAVNDFRYLDFNQIPGDEPSETKPGSKKPAKKADKK